MRRMGIGLQMYTLRDETAKDFTGTLRRVAELGYEGVEFAGYGGLAAEELRDLLQELNLKAIGAHVSLKNLKENLAGEIAYLKTIGAPYLICPYVAPEDRQTAEDWKGIYAFFQQVGEEAKKQGLQFAYHNHDFEFHLQVDGEFAFDAMYTATSADAVKVEMDVCWVQFAGQNPTEYIGKYAGRLPLLHLKDFTKDAEGKMNTVELGVGSVDLNGVISASSDAGVEWLIVEQDRCQGPSIESVTISMKWLQQHYLPAFQNA
ncbi:sugar phosphate isomerase/epimerase family protein [Paenibacillus hamazuiensis]|uniref:sugar phosphate isomerase/epimerase family protein n=1 Tax=Paenibacillus hamazuiensis TaxID=2936508 RepID=UPI0020104CC1|nr:sugar phosphate isomerase/epimerase [Paenibacillus hamazuiensis]